MFAACPGAGFEAACIGVGVVGSFVGMITFVKELASSCRIVPGGGGSGGAVGDKCFHAACIVVGVGAAVHATSLRKSRDCAGMVADYVLSPRDLRVVFLKPMTALSLVMGFYEMSHKGTWSLVNQCPSVIPFLDFGSLIHFITSVCLGA